MIRRNANITTEQLGEIIGISRRAVLKQIAYLKKQGRLRRIGPDKGGHWEAIDKNEDVKDGGAVTVRTHKDIERQSGKPVITSENLKQLTGRRPKKKR
jgi:predicted ArsR family transcriptional regulator